MRRINLGYPLNIALGTRQHRHAPRRHGSANGVELLQGEVADAAPAVVSHLVEPTLVRQTR